MPESRCKRRGPSGTNAQSNCKKNEIPGCGQRRAQWPVLASRRSKSQKQWWTGPKSSAVSPSFPWYWTQWHYCRTQIRCWISCAEICSSQACSPGIKTYASCRRLLTLPNTYLAATCQSALRQQHKVDAWQRGLMDHQAPTTDPWGASGLFPRLSPRWPRTWTWFFRWVSAIHMCFNEL